MKKSSILKFTRKCLKAGYKERVCRDTWMFGKPPTDEIKKMYEECFKGEKVAVYPYSLKRRTLKHKKAPMKITKEMLLEATGPRFVPAKMVKGKWKPLG